MKGLHPIAALLLIVMVLAFLYEEFTKLNNSNIVTSVTKVQARRHREGEER